MLFLILHPPVKKSCKNANVIYQGFHGGDLEMLQLLHRHGADSRITWNPILDEHEFKTHFSGIEMID